MDDRLNMSLDDLVKQNKSSSSGRGGGRSRGARSSSGAALSRRFPNRAAARAAPYSIPMAKAPDSLWQHDLFGNQGGSGGVGGAASSIETGTKLYISNLDYGVSNDDIKELFAEVGDVKRYGIHYDRSGRSKGTADVVFSRRLDAISAVKRYNNVELDGKPMKIEIVGTNIANAYPATIPPAVNGLFRKPFGMPRSGQGRGGPMGRPRGGRGFGRGHGGRGRARDEKVSVEDLDAELDKYHSEAMQTN